MQHLLLALSVISLMIIAGNGREAASVANRNVDIKLEKPAINNVDRDFPVDKPAVFISRFDMFFY
jgi:hypothetical protein